MLIWRFSWHAVCIAAKQDLKYIFQAFATCLFNFGFGLGLGNIFFVLVGEVNQEYFPNSRQRRYSDIFSVETGVTTKPTQHLFFSWCQHIEQAL